MRKIAILTQRTKKLKGGKKKKLWALVSKTRKDKDGKRRVLRWFGAKKPSKKTVSKAEQLIHAHSNSLDDNYSENNADDITEKFNLRKEEFPVNFDVRIEAKADLKRRVQIEKLCNEIDRNISSRKTSVMRTNRALKAASRSKRIKIQLPEGFKTWLLRKFEARGLIDPRMMDKIKWARLMKLLGDLPEETQRAYLNEFQRLDGTKIDVQTDSENITIDLGEHYPRQNTVRSVRPREEEAEDLRPRPQPFQLNLFD